MTFHTLIIDIYRMVHVNSLRPRQNGRHLADDMFKCIFLNENVWIPIAISLKFVPKVPINNIPTSHYLNQCWLDYRRIYASLGLNDLMNKRYFVTQTLDRGMFLIEPYHNWHVYIIVISLTQLNSNTCPAVSETALPKWYRHFIQFTVVRKKNKIKHKEHKEHWWRRLQPTSSITADAKSVDSNLYDFAMQGRRRLNSGAGVITDLSRRRSSLPIFKGLYLVVYMTLAPIVPVQLKECYEVYLCKNPSRNIYVYSAKLSRFESNDFASVMDVISVPGVRKGNFFFNEYTRTLNENLDHLLAVLLPLILSLARVVIEQRTNDFPAVAIN